MVSNKKFQRYEKHVLGVLDYGLKTLRDQGDFRNLRITMGDHLEEEDFLTGTNLESTKLYKNLINLDSSGDLQSRFIGDVVDRVQDAYDEFEHNHRIEIFTPVTPLKVGNIELETLYSTFGSRSLNENQKVQEKLENSTIYTTSSWDGKLFGTIANTYGSFFGVSYSQVAPFVEKKGSIQGGGSLDSDLRHFHTLSIDYLDEIKIISPNSVNINTYIDPAKNELAPTVERESLRLMRYTNQEIKEIMKSRIK